MVKACHPFNKLGIKGEKRKWDHSQLHWNQVKFILFSSVKIEDSQKDGLLGNEGVSHKEVEQMVYRAEVD